MSARRDPVPPRWVVWIVSAVLPREARAGTLGDLDERYRDRLARDGRQSADRWFVRQALAFVLRVPAARLTTLWPGRAARTGAVADLRQAFRTFRARPGLAATAIVILALAVGANTTVFSVVDAILIQRLPYPDPDRLVMLWDVYPPEANMGDRSAITLRHYQSWRDRTDLFETLGAYESLSVAIDHGEWPERVDAAVVSAGLLPMLGARPALGRLFTAADEASGAEPVVVLGHSLWVARFGAQPDLVGQTIQLNGEPVRVVGVTAPDFWFYDPYSATRSLTGRNAEAARLWRPLASSGAFGGELDYPRYRVIARLAPELSHAAAAEAAGAMRAELPPTESGSGAQVRLVPLGEQVVAESRPRLLGLFGAVALVLLIACVNLVSLLLVHLDSRRSEFAVRAALGAGRARLARQLVLESVTLAMAGGVAGLVVAHLATAWLVNLVPRGLPLAFRVQMDVGIALFGIGLSLAAGIAIGLVASLKLDPRRLSGAMASGPRTLAGTRGSRRLHGLLVTAEVALSLVLLISAALLLRGLVSLHRTDTGFDARGVLTFEATAAPGAPPGRFFEQLEERLAAMPGVAAVGGTSALPFSRWVQNAGIEVEGASGPAEGPASAGHRLVTPGYFDAIGLDVRAGRGIDATDRAGGALVAVVNEAFVARWFAGNGEAIGRVVTARRGRNVVTHTIVGVVENVKHYQLFEPDRPILYAPARQSPYPFQRFAVRVATGDPLQLIEPIRRAAAAIDPRVPLQEFIVFEALIAQSIEEETFYTQVLGAFAAVAVLLTVVGIYGVVSYATRQRDREVGIRMALGAHAQRVGLLILRQGLQPVVVGLGLGIVGALTASRLLRGLLHDVPATDPASFALATGGFAAIAAVACLVPARRASRVDPVQVLRGE